MPDTWNCRLGKLALILGDGTIPRFYAEVAAAPSKNQFLLEFSDGSAFCVTVAMYGMIWLCDPDAFDNKYYRGAREKPTPYEADFSPARFDFIASGPEFPRLSAKAFLATEQRIPGLGNGCCQDILFNARMSPKRKMGTVDRKGLGLLYDSVKKTLATMRDSGGRDTESNLYGKPGAYRTIMSKKGLAAPCPRCGGAIVRQAYLGGNVYFCPDCQV